MKDRLIAIEEILLSEVEQQMEHLDCVNACELGEVIDMIKDIEECKYYLSKWENKKEGDN